MYEAITRGIRVRAAPQFLEDKSAPEQGRFLWAYTIDIVNEGSEVVQLRSRHWRFTDAEGRTEEVRRVEPVRGPCEPVRSIVGLTPVLMPGASFRYASRCPLNTPSGTMVGRFRMCTEAG